MTSDLSRFRIDTKPKPTPPPIRPGLADGYVMAIDQSLSATGWVVLQVENGAAYVASANSLFLPLEPKGGLPALPKGHEGNLRRAVAIHQHLTQAMALWKKEREGLVVVHEHPPLGGRMMRPESSLLAAGAVRIAAAEHGLPVVMVDNQHSKALLAGARNVTKSEWHKGLILFAIQGVHASNEGQRDALCLGITHCIDKAQES